MSRSSDPAKNASAEELANATNMLSALLDDLPLDPRVVDASTSADIGELSRSSDPSETMVVVGSILALSTARHLAAGPPRMAATQVPPKALLFDIDGTLFNSDSLHFSVFQDVLLEKGFANGIPIDETFFRERISGRANAAICSDLFPLWSAEEGERFAEYKEHRFRELAADRLPALSTAGLANLLEWVDANGVRAAAVTNAPRANAELMLKSIGRLEWFDAVVIGDECERAKPDPEPYLVAMQARQKAFRCHSNDSSPDPSPFAELMSRSPVPESLGARAPHRTRHDPAGSRCGCG